MHLKPTSLWENNFVRLFLLQAEHATNSYVDWLKDPQVNQFLESRFSAHSIETVRRYIISALDDPDVLFLGIHSKEIRSHVGNIKVGPIDRRHALGEIGLMIGAREVWGRGVATHAIRLVSEICFKELGLRKLTAGCYASNVGSKIAFERAGYAVEGVRKRHYLSLYQEEDLVLLARFAECQSETQGG